MIAQAQGVGFGDGMTPRDHYTRGSSVAPDTAGHNVHLEQPEVVGTLVRGWLDRADTAHRVASAQILGVE